MWISKLSINVIRSCPCCSFSLLLPSFPLWLSLLWLPWRTRINILLWLRSLFRIWVFLNHWLLHFFSHLDHIQVLDLLSLQRGFDLRRRRQDWDRGVREWHNGRRLRLWHGIVLKVFFFILFIYISYFILQVFAELVGIKVLKVTCLSSRLYSRDLCVLAFW